ncbi:MAG: FecCD family ABC transporter permease [Phycisphaeraceae bacterium]
MSRPRRWGVWVLLIVLLLALAATRLMLGSDGFGWPGDAHAGLIIEARLQRTVVAVIVGVALAVSGVALQALLRNPLAEPYILGLSTGAGLGIIVQGYLALQFGLMLGTDGVGAAIGTALTLAIVFFASRRRGVIDRLGLLLVGVVLGTINGAGILFFTHLTRPTALDDNLAQWMMGVLPVRLLAWTDGVAASIVAGLIALLVWQGRAMDVATLDDDEAASLGVHTGRLKTLLLLSASVLTALAVLIAGPIAFVGLIAPHTARALLGPSHRQLILGAALLGGSLLVGADLASAAVAWQWPGVGRVPVGIFAAMIGGPVFLWILRPQLGRGLE